MRSEDLRKQKWNISLLGTFSISREGANYTPQPKDSKVLAYIALKTAVRRDHACPLEELFEVFWPEMNPENQRTCFRASKNRLRKMLHLDLDAFQRLLPSNKSHVQFHLDIVWIDLLEFETAIAKSNQQDCPEERQTQHLIRAHSLYRESLLSGFYEDPFVSERVRIEREYVRALQRLTDLYTDVGMLADAIYCIEKLLDTDEVDTDAHLQLVQLLQQDGQQEAALKHLERMENIWRKGNGESLPPEAVQLRQALFQGRGLAGSFPTRSSKRLPSIRSAEHAYSSRESGMYSLGDSDLLIPHTELIGRTEDITQTLSNLTTARVVTLTGSPGVGKTRVALQAAAEALMDYDGGVRFVDLAALEPKDANRVPWVVLTKLGFPEQPQQPALSSLQSTMSSEQMLIVMDNCDMVIEAVANMEEHLLQHCQDVKFLNTSREVLNIYGEVTQRIDPLPIPQEEDVIIEVGDIRELERQFAGVRLFLQRAREANAAVVLTNDVAEHLVDICRKVAGIPLLLELAAALARTLTIPEIAERGAIGRGQLASRRTAVKHHTTMQATFDWSYSLLTLPQKRLFRSLAVFASGWTREAAATVLSREDGPTEEDVLKDIGVLVDKSFVQRQEYRNRSRYRFLQPIRQYAAEKLEEVDEAAYMRIQHAEYFVHLAEQAQNGLQGSEQVEWQARLDAEHDNLRTALQTLLQDSQRAEQCLRLAGSLWWFWFIRGYLAEGRSWLEEARKLYTGVPTKVLAHAVASEATLLWAEGKYSEAINLATDARRMAQTVSDPNTEAEALHVLTLAALSQREAERAEQLIRESLNLRRSVGNQWGEAWALSLLGHVTRWQRGWDAAKPYYEQTLTLRRQIGDIQGMSNSLLYLSHTSRYAGDFAIAKEGYAEALGMICLVGDRRAMPDCIEGYSFLLTRSGHFELAIQLLSAAQWIRDMTGFQLRFEMDEYTHCLEILKQQISDNRYTELWADGSRLSHHEVLTILQADQRIA